LFEIAIAIAVLCVLGLSSSCVRGQPSIFTVTVFAPDSHKAIGQALPSDCEAPS
jgi:hypothetical protein